MARFRFWIGTSIGRRANPKYSDETHIACLF